MVKRQNKGCGKRLQTSSLQVFSLSFNPLYLPSLKCGINSGATATASPTAQCGCPRVIPPGERNVPFSSLAGGAPTWPGRMASSSN